ncbi:contactin-2-like [Gigantopelta aegis]|uniref:contactin-2-like n=1 Tax=Gigantopelta aegis TaxID=1735272 RepID=UPI001B889CB0|nr:contactin-2-like [Gigantopelta aegis]
MAVLLCLLVSVIAVNRIRGLALNLSGPGNAVLNEAYTFQCYVSPADEIQGPVGFTTKGSSVCTVLSNCRLVGAVLGYSCGCAGDSGTTRIYNMTISSVTLRDEADWTCIHTDDISNSLHLTVLYAPDVTVTGQATVEGNTMTVICEAVGKPASYTFHGFSHSWRNQFIRTVNGTKVEPDTYVWTVQSASYEDSGDYQCSVDNQIPDRNNTVIQINTTSVLVKGKPIITLESESGDIIYEEIGQQVTMYKTVFSQGNISKYQWTKDNEILSGKLTDTDIRETKITLSLFEKINVTDTGYNITLTIKTFQETDEGRYRLEVCNTFKCATFITDLIAAGPPSVPSSFSAYDSTSDAVFLTWIAGFPGGQYTQRFLVEFKEAGRGTEWTQQWYNDHAARNQKIYMNITGLHPGRVYVFRLLAENTRKHRNRSPFTSELTMKTKERCFPPASPDKLSGEVGIAVGIVIGIAISALAVTVFVILWRRGYICTSSNADKQKADMIVYEDMSLDGRGREASNEVSTSHQETNTYEGLGPREATPYAELEIHEHFKN